MTTEIESKKVSRRRLLPLLGVAAAAGLALRSTAAEAQTNGMERRQERRGGRVDRRQARRGGTPAAKQPAFFFLKPPNRPGQPAQGAPAQGQPAQGAPAQGQPAQGQPAQGPAGAQKQ